MSLTEEQKKILAKTLFIEHFGHAITGEEDPKTVIQKIIEGKRPPNWNTAGHPDHDLWVKLTLPK